MKTMDVSKSRVVSFVLVLVLMLAVFNLPPSSTVHAAQSGDYVYTVSNGQATITQYLGWDNTGTVTIPSTLGGYPVVKIDEYAFAFFYISGVTIPNSVTSIGEAAFLYCEYLKTVHFGSKLKTIGEGAFYGSGLTGVTIPDSVTSIGEGAFGECRGLTGVSIGSGVARIGFQAFECENLAAITVDAGNRYFASLNGVLFNKDRTQLIQYPAGKAGTSYTIPESVTVIGDYAFLWCGKLTGVTIPDSVTMLGECAFYGCSKLAAVSIGSGVTSIDEGAFDYCDALAAFTVSAGNASFASQSGVLFNKGETELVLYPAGRSNTGYTVPNGVTAIRNNAFLSCVKLTSVTMPDSVTAIGEYAFVECGKLAAVDLGNGVQSIGDGAFLYCASLTGIAIPDSTTEIGDFAFAECYKLAQADIGNGVTSLGEYVFAYCYGLTDVVIPDSVTSLGESAFEGCEKLAGVTLGSGVTDIGRWAFYSCESLKSITIPESVTNISYMAFYSCESLSAAYFMGDAPKAHGSTFYQSGPGFTSYYLSGKTGFTNPWKGYPTAVFDPGTTFTVTFSLNGAAGTPPTAQSVYDGVKAQEPADPARSGYTFSGWYTNAACTGAAWDFFDSVTDDTTLYAKWTPLPPTKPSYAKAVSASYDSVRLTWGASSFASGYEIYRTSANGTIYGKAATVTGTRTCTVPGLKCGTTYYFKVRAYRDTAAGKKYSGYTSVVSAVPVPRAPGSVKATLAKDMGVQVSWGAVDGATGYEVWRAKAKNGAYERMTSTAATSYTNTQCTPGTTYYYKVRAYRKEGSTRVYGAYSSVVSKTMKLATPVAAANSESYNSIRVEWNAVTAASGYEVYRANSANGTYAKVYTGASGTCVGHTDTGLTTNTTYYYKVRAYQNTGQGKVYGDLSAAVSAKPVPSAPKNIGVVRLSPTSLKVDWDPVSGATKYEVYRCATAAGAFAPVAETAVSIYYNTGLPADQKYYYKVRAYRLVGDTRVYGPFSAVVSE